MSLIQIILEVLVGILIISNIRHKYIFHPIIIILGLAKKVIFYILVYTGTYKAEASFLKSGRGRVSKFDVYFVNFPIILCMLFFNFFYF